MKNIKEIFEDSASQEAEMCESSYASEDVNCANIDIDRDFDTIKCQQKPTGPNSPTSTTNCTADDKYADENTLPNHVATNTGGLQKRKMYCPLCYEDFYVYGNTCPKCGAILEESLTDDEEEEYIEMLMSTRL